MTTIKISYKTDTRRITFSVDENQSNYSRLINNMYHWFPALESEEDFCLTWRDDVCDQVLCSSEDELVEAIKVMQKARLVLHFTIKINKTPSVLKAIDPPIHANIPCSECGTNPITGTRYKCVIRKEFNLCAACEAKQIQPYPMIKIRDPAQAPTEFVYGLADGTLNEECFDPPTRTASHLSIHHSSNQPTAAFVPEAPSIPAENRRSDTKNSKRGSYVVYCAKKRPQLQATYPDAQSTEIEIMLVQMWFQLSETEKAAYTVDEPSEVSKPKTAVLQPVTNPRKSSTTFSGNSEDPIILMIFIMPLLAIPILVLLLIEGRHSQKLCVLPLV